MPVLILSDFSFLRTFIEVFPPKEAHLFTLNVGAGTCVRVHRRVGVHGTRVPSVPSPPAAELVPASEVVVPVCHTSR